MGQLAFEARDLVYRYQQTTALDGLSISVRAGERLALVGANGSGKSTLLRLLDGLIFPQSGELAFFNDPITEDRFRDSAFTFAFRRRVGLVFQNPDVQLFNYTVFDELAFGPLQLRWPKDRIRDSVENTLIAMDIAHLRDRSPHRLSGGEKKRVAIASITILDPEVLLLDEPTAALDPRSEAGITDLLVSWGGGRKTVVTATHDLDRLEEIADRCLLFEGGRIVAEGTPFDILHNVPLLERARLVHPHRHTHAAGESHPHAHPHVHG